MLLPEPRPFPLDHLTLRGVDTATALTSREGDVTYSTLDQRVGQMASWLIAQGLKSGDRVASWLPKTTMACVLPLAAARAGMIHVPINPVLRRAQAAHILIDSGAAMLITQSPRAASFEEGDVPDGCVVVFEPDVRDAIKTLAAMPCSDRDPSELCAILYTSGSTGKPKGVMLNHANLWLGAVSVAHYLELTPEDRTLAVLPLAFDYGQNQLLSTWAVGGTVIPLDYLTARDVIKAIDKHDATTLAGVPPLWHQLVEAEWPEGVGEKLRRVTNSGGALTPSLIDRMREVFPEAGIVPMYGLTEAFRSTYLPPALVAEHPTSMGRAIPFAEILVVRPDGSIAADEEPGELVHCGPLVALGYWHDAERTALRYKPAPAASQYGGMAVWSGDTVRRDANGLHYFVGRDDEMIKVSGNRISPTEIENAAVASGVVAEAVAIGVSDSRLGQAVVLVARADREADVELMDYFKREIPAFMHPSRVIWKSDLPRNANGKLDRSAIRAEVLS